MLRNLSPLHGALLSIKMGLLVALAKFWYNTTYHSAHGHTPFEALYGYPPKHFGIAITDSCSGSDLNEWIESCNTILQHIQHNLTRAQQCMKSQADKHR